VTAPDPRPARLAAAATSVRARAREAIGGLSLAPCDAAIFGIVMPNYRELLQQVKSEIEEVDAPGARDLLDSIDPPLLVDVREQDEWNEGHLPGAVHVPRGNLESRIDRAAPDRSGSIVLYCQSGHRSVFASKTLEDPG